MASESNFVDNVSTDVLTDKGSSDDDLLFTDDFDDNSGDLLMLHCFVANKRSTIGRRPCRTSLFTGKMLKILNGHLDMCYRNFRMQKHVFINFCATLKEKVLLTDGKK
ncbi:protein ALP1-like [Forsythia ovata]|uniref:Protein ALP1-like n=1 Tax=Forsythia ovata TaxID=205694 RepID=A0ABD1U792_9LAMI